MTYSQVPLLLSTVGRLLLWRPSILPSFVTAHRDSLQSCKSHWCQNKHTDKQTKANTHQHTQGQQRHKPPPLSSKSDTPHIATNISHELLPTSPSWIFIKQNSKQIDFTPAALLHFYLILFSLCVAPPFLYLSFTTPSFSPYLSFLMHVPLPLCISHLFLSTLSLFCLLWFLLFPYTLFFHFPMPYFPAAPDLCSMTCGPEDGCCWWADELCFVWQRFYQVISVLLGADAVGSFQIEDNALLCFKLCQCIQS